MREHSVGIVGGGASGMMAAVTAARERASVTLLEGNDRPGRKLLSTGNGKCNLGNENLNLGMYYTDCPERLGSCLSRFGTADTIAFFQGIGLMVKSRNGYLYPASEQASSVLDALRYAMRQLGVQMVTECRIEQIEKTDTKSQGQAGWLCRAGDGRAYCFDRVILACGGRAAPKTGSDGGGYRLAERLGHSLIPISPALVQLRCGGEDLRSVAGVRAEASLEVVSGGKTAARERGELQLTEYGLSGIPVFQISRVANGLLREGGDVTVRIDLLPDVPREAYAAACADRLSLRQGRTVEEFFTGICHKKLMLHFIRLAGLKASADAACADLGKIERVYRLCKDWAVRVTGSNSYDHAQVCAGGVPLREVTETLESRKAPGVYFAGELLDVDGKCGGYNLQWAWCSGHIAGAAAGSSTCCPFGMQGRRMPDR